MNDSNNIYIVSNPKHEGFKVGIGRGIEPHRQYNTSDPDRAFKTEFNFITPHAGFIEDQIHSKFKSDKEWVYSDLKTIKKSIMELNNTLDFSNNYRLYETKDYSIFKKVDQNRLVKQANVNKIKKSIQEVGHLICPIVVDENCNIIDGQHRLRACEELDHPALILQNNLTTVSDISTAQTGKGWTNFDYLTSFATLEKPGYQELYASMEKYHFGRAGQANKPSVSAVGAAFCNSTDFKTGKLNFDAILGEKTMFIADLLFPIVGNKYAYATRVLLAIRSIVSKNQYKIDFNHFEEALRNTEDIAEVLQVKSKASAMQYDLIKIYNKDILDSSKKLI